MCVLCHGLRRFGRAKLVAMGGVCTVLYALGAFRRLFGDYWGAAPNTYNIPQGWEVSHYGRYNM